MRMPQDFLDAINAAVREVNPNAGVTTYGDMFLGSDFDEWLGPDAIKKYGFGPMPPDALAAFEAKFDERRDELKSSVVASAVDVEKRRMAGTLIDEAPATCKQSRPLSDVVAEIKQPNSVG